MAGQRQEPAIARAELCVDLDAITANWRALDRLSGAGTETAAVVKADAYGLGADRVAAALAAAGARSFFVALAEEGAALRQTLGPGPAIYVFSGLMPGDAPLMAAAELIPCLNSPEQIAACAAALPGARAAVQLDSGMNRLGLEPEDLPACRDAIARLEPVLILSHLASADMPDHPQNRAQLTAFRAMAEALPPAPLSLAATGGTLLGPDYHFAMTRPGIGLYGGLPFRDARPTLRLSLPVIQTRTVAAGESVGYGAAWTARRPARIATLSAGYADGLRRALSGRGVVALAGDRACPVVGRLSMDLIAVDVTGLDPVPETLDILGPAQGIDALAAAAGTIGYEILTGLGPRLARRYKGAGSGGRA